MSERSPAARFRDAHTHLSAGAVDLADLDLREVAAPDAAAARVALAAGGCGRGRWIRGFGWDGDIGLAAMLDRAVPDHPVFLARRDGHAACVNAAARVALGLPPATAVVEERDFEDARGRLPQRSLEDRTEAARARSRVFASLGVAIVDDFAEPWGPEIYARLRDRGELPIAVGLWLPESLDPGDAEALRRAFPPGERSIAVRGIKIFLDGTLAGRTAALWQPYADDPGTAGDLRIREPEIGERVLRWAARGWPVALHAIGDRAVSLALDALERAPRPPVGAHRIEHAQVVRRADLPRFARAGIVASLQPGHWSDDRPWLMARLGRREGVVAHPLASFLRAGAKVVFGSDWPVSSAEPEAILAAASNAERGEEALPRDAALAIAAA